jgi:hypothetical protein
MVEFIDPVVRFALCEAVPTSTEQVLGLWVTAPLPEERETDLPVWRAIYPADLNRAALQRDKASELLAVFESALTATPARIDRVVTRGAGARSYDLSDVRGSLAKPERELLELLQAGGGGPLRSYGLSDELPTRWDELTGVFQDFMGRLGRMVSHLAWVETHIGGRLAGQTAVAWTGGMETVFAGELASKGMHLHQHTLDLVLASRRTMLRTATVVVANGVKLSALLAAPAGAVLALPAVFRFINQVRAELVGHLDS